MHSVGRRGTLAGWAALAGATLIRPREARAAKAMTVVLESEVTILDPHFITATITRTFGLHVFDMLFAMNEKGEIKPQMVDSWEVSADKLGWSFTLRDGLKWHDGIAATAPDCVASLKRWSVRDPLGKMLMADTASLEAADARTFKLVLKEPFPLMLEVLGKPNAPCGDDAGAHRGHIRRPAHSRTDRLGSVPLSQGPVAAWQCHGAGTQPRLPAAQRTAGFPGGRQASGDRPARRSASCRTSRPAPMR